MLNRGDIVFVTNQRAVGCEECKDRYAIVVSNDVCNRYSPVVEIVYLSMHKFHKELPTHVVITSAPQVSVAMCEAIYSVDTSRIIRCAGRCSEMEMRRIDRALLISLGLVGSW